MEVAFIGEEDDGKYNNFDGDHNNNDEHLIWYDWLVDNATTSHVSHQWRLLSHICLYIMSL
jgi:hypothetical protein